MIAVSLVLGKEGNLVSAEAEGHAGKGTIGTDIVCAAVTILLRTTMATIASRPSVVLEAETAGRGSLAFHVSVWGKTDIPFLQFASAFLQEGLSSLQVEYPQAVVMRVEINNDYCTN